MIVQSKHTVSSTSCFTCEGLGAQRGGITLYEGVGFCLNEGAVLAISAPNGIGKTTLLGQCAGFSNPASGTLKWFGRTLASARTYEGDMLYIGDTNGLYAELTVAEQLNYFARAFGQKERLAATVRYLELEPYMDMRSSMLSAGWKRRVALSRLLLIPALLWLIDEPFSHLDSHASGLIVGMIHSHAERGGITILTMPMMETPLRIPNTPVSVLQLSDFVPS